MSKPKRPKSHETQTRAEQIFESIIGPAWIATPTTKDYGIDYEVEVFSEGEATGLTFKAQVKGHDVGASQRKAVVKQSSLNLWAALDVPVLIVGVYLIDDVKFEVWIKWAHSYDPYPHTRVHPKTRTIRFEQSDLIGSKFPHMRVHEQLEMIREARAGRFTIPVKCTVELRNDYSGITPTELGYLLRDIEVLSSGVLTLAGPGRTSGLDVELCKGQITAALVTRLRSFTMHFSQSNLYSGPTEREFLPIDVVAIAGIVLSQAGNTSLAARAIQGLRVHSNVFASSTALTAYTYVVQEERRPDIALAISGTLVTAEDADTRDLGSQYFESAITMLEGLPDTLVSHFIACVEQWVQLEIEAGLPIRAAAAAQKAANILKYNGALLRSLGWYDRALELNPQLYELTPFLNMLAGLYWRTGQFERSASCYERAAELADSPSELNSSLIEGLAPAAVAPTLMRTLQADALKHGGQFRAALEVCQNLDSDPASNTEHLLLVLNTASLRHIMQVTGLYEQHRRVPVLPATELTTPEIVVRLRESDALSAGLWTVLAESSDDPVFAYNCACTAAVANESSGELWALAVVRAIDADIDEAMVYGLVQRGVRLARDEFVWEVEAACQSELGESWSTAETLMHKAISESLVSAPDPNRPRIFF